MCLLILTGVVAQLVERYNGIVEVRGSIPLDSTKNIRLIMYKYDLTNKNIIVVTLLILILTFLSINTSYADETSTKADTPYSNIDTPSENIKKIPIIDYKFVFTTYNASLVDFLEKEIENFKNNLVAVGIKEKNMVIIYLDFSGYLPNIGNYEDNSTKNTYTKYTTTENIVLDLSQMNKKYSISFLATKRKALIGTLIDNNNPFNGNQNLSVVKFNIPDAQGFQYSSKSSYTKQRNKSQEASKANRTDLSYSDSEKNNEIEQLSYTKEELIQQRANMIQYMNLTKFKKTNFIGMMEYHDLVNNVYAYFALPGNVNDIFYPKDK